MAGVLLFALTATSAAPKQPNGTPEGAERTVIFGAGVALDVAPSAFKSGAATFVEYEAIDGVLELELGGQSVWGRGGRELSADLIFKWPRRLTPSLELMIGAGPTVVSSARTSWGVEGAVDVMWWPTRRFGLWIEPVYDVLFSSGLSTSSGLTFGPIVGW
jgi:hypothetical protein